MKRLVAGCLIAAILAVTTVASAAEGPCRVRSAPFGHMPDGRQVDVYTMTNDRGMEVRVMTLGATLLTVKAPDRDGHSDHVTLYLDTLDDYLRGHPLFGSIVGRYANRIAGATFTIDGQQFRLTPNAGKNHIHGGRAGFQKLIWQAEAVRDTDSAGVALSHTSPDGTEGYPGTLQVTVTYRLTADNQLRIEYLARTDRPTHVNLTNHAYWNLAGAGSGDVLGHVLLLNATRYLPADESKIPQGPPKPVRGTPMDFTRPMTIGSRIDQVEDRNYDHCYVLRKEPGEVLSVAARLVDPNSGRAMEVLTSQPGVQLYTAKGLSPKLSGGGRPYGPYHGVCLETQHYPNSPNRPDFPSTLLRPDRPYRHVTIHKFSTVKERE